MPIIWTTIAFTLGILGADALDWSAIQWGLLGVVACGVAWILIRLVQRRSIEILPNYRSMILALLISFFLGALRFTVSLPDLEDPSYIIHQVDMERRRRVIGVVVDDPDRREQITNLRLKVQYIDHPDQKDWLPVRGEILVKVPAETEVAYGDRVEIHGYLSLPPQDEDFDYRSYLRRQNIYAFMPRSELEILERRQGFFPLQVIYNLRTSAMDLLYRLWPDPEASLLAGILLGVETGISDQVQRAFRQTGTTHVIAISGFNITIVAGIFSRFFSRIFDRWKGALAAGIGILVYTILVGADPAVTRAAVMGGFSIFARQIGRRQHGLNAAALASLVIFLFDPQLPWSISFQLSLSATLGLILYADPLAGWFTRFSSRFLSIDVAERITGPVSEYVLFTFAAQLTTLPVTLFHFRTFSLSTFIANPIILPVQPPIMVLGGMALILGLIWHPLGVITAPLVYPFVMFTIRMVEWVNLLPITPFAVGEISLVWVWLYYSILLLLTFRVPYFEIMKPVLINSFSLSGVLIMILLVWRMVFSLPDNRLDLYFMDVGTGTGILITSPSGKRVLINGGPSPRDLSEHLGRRLPPFNRELDLLLVASPLAQDLDSLGAILPRFHPKEIIWLGGPGMCWEAEYLRGKISEIKIPLHEGDPGEVLDFQDGLQIRILSETPRGGTLLVEFGSFRGLFPFGITNASIEELLNNGDLGEISVYMLADHGYQSSNPSYWIDALHPQLVLLSVGVNNNQGLPNRGLLDRLAGYSLLRTDAHGTIHLSTDGKRLWIELEEEP